MYLGLLSGQLAVLLLTQYRNHTIVPKVTRPTKEFSGKRLKLMINESFSADKLSSSWQVSTT
jgi:hypothetical protein